MGLFACKVCLEKDKRISDLKDEVAQLRTQVFPNNDPYNQSLVVREADAILNATTETLSVDSDLSVERSKIIEELTAERNSLLDGSYTSHGKYS